MNPYGETPHEMPRAAAGDAPSMQVPRPFSLDTRPDWMLAVRREDARNVRYGRPVSVVILELTSEETGRALDVVAGDVADVIREQSRSTDRAVRLSAGSFRILMPETGATSARVAADRLERTYESTASGERGETLRVAVVSSSRARSLPEALADAEERLRSA